MNIKKDLDKIDDKKVLLGIKRSIDGHLKLPFFKTNSYISKIIDVIFNHKFNIDRINTITRDIINRIQLIDAYVEDIDAKFNEFDNKNDARNEAFKYSILNKMLENQTLSEASFKLENNNLLNKIENLNEIIDHLDHKYLKLLTSIRDENFEQNRKNALLISTLNEKIEEFKKPIN
jgi:predicted RNase H-like nuclease (RuvC/YqgF family)